MSAELHLDEAIKRQEPAGSGGHYTTPLLSAADALIDMGVIALAKRCVCVCVHACVCACVCVHVCVCV